MATNQFIQSYYNVKAMQPPGVAATAPGSIVGNVGNPRIYPENNVQMLNYSNATYNQLGIQKQPTVTPRDQQLYSQLHSRLDTTGKPLLEKLHQSGKLYSRDATDNSSTLENLYRIMSEPRLPYFKSQIIMNETLKTLNDPYIITQNRGHVPGKLMPKIKFDNTNKGHTCPAASVEFSLADRRPAEFARYVEGLSSPRQSVKTIVRYTDLLPNPSESISVMAQQNTEFRPYDWQSAEVTIRPDHNAYFRSYIQEDYRDKNSMSVVDMLVQSALMQLGARGTYDSLKDERSKDTGDGKGLNQFEVAYIESIVDGKSRKVPMVYMDLNDEATKILKYNYNNETTKKQLVSALDQGNNIITGFLTNMDNKGNVLSLDGHEILLTGYKYDQNGKLKLKYQDSDDGDYFAPSWMDADKFIPTIHHANVPMSVVGNQIS